MLDAEEPVPHRIKRRLDDVEKENQISSDLVTINDKQQQQEPYHVYMAIKKKTMKANQEEMRDQREKYIMRELLMRIISNSKSADSGNNGYNTSSNSGSGCSEKNNGTRKRKRSSGGDRVILKVSTSPFIDIHQLNQESMIDLQSTDLEIIARNMQDLINCTPENYQSEISSNCNMLSRPLKKSKRQKTKSCDYRLVLMVSGFNNKEEAILFRLLWDYKSRGPIPRLAWGIYIAIFFGLEIHGDLGEVFNNEASIWNVAYVKNRWVIIKS